MGAWGLSGADPGGISAERDLAISWDAVGGGIDEDSEILVWVRAVAMAMLAGVIAKIVLFATWLAGRRSAVVRLWPSSAGFWPILRSGDRSLRDCRPARPR